MSEVDKSKLKQFVMEQIQKELGKLGNRSLLLSKQEAFAEWQNSLERRMVLLEKQKESQFRVIQELMERLEQLEAAGPAKAEE